MSERDESRNLENKQQNLRSANRASYDEIRVLIGDENERIIQIADGEISIIYGEDQTFDEEYNDRLIHINFTGKDGNRESYDITSVGLVSAGVNPANFKSRLGVRYKKILNIDAEWMNFSDDFCGQIKVLLETIQAGIQEEGNNVAN